MHTTTTLGRNITALLLALAALLVLTGCGRAAEPADRDTIPLTRDNTAGTPAPSPTASPTEDAVVPGPGLVARANGDVQVFDAPDDADPSQTLPATTVFGTRTVLLALDPEAPAPDGWLEVLLPVRPNASTGWVRTADVELREVTLHLVIDLDARELSVLDGDEVVLTTPTAIGDADHPTPTGRFYVTDKLETDDPAGAYGPYALGLSAYSDVLTEFAGGEGQVGIHGTNVPSSIGQPASHGCLRVDNGVIEQLAHMLPLGTPVTIL